MLLAPDGPPAALLSGKRYATGTKADIKLKERASTGRWNVCTLQCVKVLQLHPRARTVPVGHCGTGGDQIWGTTDEGHKL